MLFGVRRKRSSSSEHLHGSREVPGAGEKAVGCVRPHWGWLGPGGGGARMLDSLARTLHGAVVKARVLLYAGSIYYTHIYITIY